MSNDRFFAYLRSHRLKSGLSQQELAMLLDYSSDAQISRHERVLTRPSLEEALGYEIVFQTPVSELFAGIVQSLSHGIEERVIKLEHALQQKSAQGRDAQAIARKLEWIWERNNQAKS